MESMCNMFHKRNNFNGNNGSCLPFFKFNLSFIRHFNQSFNLPLSPSYNLHTFDPEAGILHSNFFNSTEYLTFSTIPKIIYFHPHRSFYVMDYFLFLRLNPNYDLDFHTIKYGSTKMTVAMVIPKVKDLSPLFFTADFKKFLSTSVHLVTFSFDNAFSFYNPPLRHRYTPFPESRFSTQSSIDQFCDPSFGSSNTTGIGFMDVLTGVFRGVGFLYSLGLQLLEFPTLFTRAGKFLSDLNKIPLALARNPSALISFVTALFRLLHDLSSNFSISNICFDFLQMLTPFWGVSQFTTQSFSFYKILSSLVGIPSDVHSLLLKLYKIADVRNSPIVQAYELIVSILIKVLGFVTDMVSKAFPDTFFSKSLITFLNKISFSSNVFEYESKLSALLVKFNKNQNLMHTPTFRQEILDMKKYLDEATHFHEALVNPSYKYLNSLYRDFNSLIKNVEAFSNPSRVVPAFIVLEGPPGTFKSTVLAKISSYFSSPEQSKSIYTHVWKTTYEGKDFYDDYQNQDVMILDDVGQGGVGQWAKVMNFVSSIKLPLDCAEAEKKNTKFFTSEYIFCTTNLFSKIQTTTPQDGIADLEALFRRPLLFSFNLAHPDFEGEPLITATVKHFDYINSHSWKVGLPDHLIAILASKNFEPKTTHTGPPGEVASWITAMADLMAYNHKNNMEHTNAGFTKQDVNAFFSTQSFLKPTSYNFSSLNSEPETVHAFKTSKYSFSSLYSSSEVAKPEGTFSCSMLNDIVDPIQEPNFYTPASSSLSEILSFLNLPSFSSFCTSFSSATAPFVNFLLSLFSVLSEFSTKFFATIKEGTEKSFAFLQQFPSINILFGSLFFLVTGSLLFFLRYLYTRKSTKNLDKKTLQTFAPPRPFETQGLVFDDTIDQSPSSHVYLLHAYGNNFCTKSLCVISGRRAIVTKHSIFKTKYLTIFKNTDEESKGNKMLEAVTYDIIYEIPSSELCIIQFRIAINNLFKKARSIFHSPLETSSNSVSGCRFATCDGVVDYSSRQLHPNLETFSVWCDAYGKDLIFSPGQGFFHPLSDPGMCGAPLFSQSHGFLGVHVAGDDTKSSYLNGFVAVCGKSERQKISELMLDCGEGLDLNSLQHGSGMRIRYADKEVTPRTPLKRSRLFDTGAPVLEGIEPRIIPSMVNNEGRSLIKEIVSPILDSPGKIEAHVVEFCQSILELDYDSYTALNWKEVVSGGNGLAPLNKDSVNGYGYESDKNLYIDFENGKLTDSYLEYINDFEERLLKGEIELTEMMAYHALKDETRPIGKIPRTFAVMPLHLTVLFKKYFGNLFNQVKEERHTNGYALGLNPYKEWNLVWNKLTSNGKLLMDGDFKRYDRSLVAPMLEGAMFSMRKFFRGTDREKEIQKALCNLIARMFILVGDEVYLVTHGLQSGWWLTAFVNSAFNKMISIATLYLNLPRKENESDHKFKQRCRTQFSKISEYYLGDDRISGVPKELAPYFNMWTMKQFVVSLGMDMTDGLKNPITPESRFCNPENVSFLKRLFVMTNNPARPVSCPLSLITLGHLFKYVDESKDVRQVLEDRSVVYQIEKTLHADSVELEEYEEAIKEFYASNNLVWKKFSKTRIEEILTSDEGYLEMMSTLGKFTDY